MKALIVLGGGLIFDQKAKIWRTCGFGEGDGHGVTISMLRVHAGAVLFKEGSYDLLVSSGRGLLSFNDPAIPAEGDVMQKELLELGIPQDKIVVENHSNNTFEQLRYLRKLCDEKQITEVGFITNEWHVPRVWTMIMMDPALGFSTAKFFAAEEVLQSRRFFVEEIESTRTDPGTMRRKARELQGILNLILGTYKS